MIRQNQYNGVHYYNKLMNDVENLSNFGFNVYMVHPDEFWGSGGLKI